MGTIVYCTFVKFEPEINHSKRVFHVNSRHTVVADDR